MGYKIALIKFSTFLKIDLDSDKEIEIGESLFPSHEKNIEKIYRLKEKKNYFLQKSSKHSQQPQLAKEVMKKFPDDELSKGKRTRNKKR